MWSRATPAKTPLPSDSPISMRHFATSSLLLAEPAIDRLDERIRRTVSAVVVERRPRGLHLIQRLTSTHERLNAIAGDRRHVPVLHDVGLVSESAVPRDDVRAAFLLVAGNRDVDDAVQPIEDALDAAAARSIDDGVAGGAEQVAGGDDI